jgi:hypothetical protein
MTCLPIKKFLVLTLPFILTAGCVQSHRGTYAYNPAYSTAPTAVAVSPTSDYNRERVYRVPTETVVTTRTTTVEVPPTPVATRPGPVIVSEPPPNAPVSTASASDLVLGGEIPRAIAQDGDFVAAARDTRISIYDGIVTITGTTVTRNDRERLLRAIETVPGIRSIDNRVRATLDRSY